MLVCAVERQVSLGVEYTAMSLLIPSSQQRHFIKFVGSATPSRWVACDEADLQHRALGGTASGRPARLQRHRALPLERLLPGHVRRVQ